MTDEQYTELVRLTTRTATKVEHMEGRLEDVLNGRRWANRAVAGLFVAAVGSFILRGGLADPPLAAPAAQTGTP